MEENIWIIEMGGGGKEESFQILLEEIIVFTLIKIPHPLLSYFIVSCLIKSWGKYILDLN